MNTSISVQTGYPAEQDTRVMPAGTVSKAGFAWTAGAMSVHFLEISRGLL